MTSLDGARYTVYWYNLSLTVVTHSPLRAHGPSFGVGFENEGLEEFLGAGFVLIVELSDSLKEHFKVVGRLSFLFIKNEGVGADVKQA